MGYVSLIFFNLWVMCHFIMPSVSKQLWEVCSWVVIHNQFVLFTIKYIYSILVIELISQMCKQINFKLNKSKRFIFVLDFK